MPEVRKEATAIIWSLTLLLGKRPRWRLDSRFRLLGHTAIIVLGLAGGLVGKSTDLWAFPSHPVVAVLASVDEQPPSLLATSNWDRPSPPVLATSLETTADRATDVILAYSDEEMAALSHRPQVSPTVAEAAKKEAPEQASASPTAKPTATPTIVPLPVKALVEETPKATAAPPPPPSPATTDVVALAMQFLGAPYVWAGTTPQGFDCTGFVRYVYGQKGIDLPRTVRGQFAVGTAVERQVLEPGDLVFFQNTFERGLSHVGIYIGGGRFISAASESRGVALDDLNSPFWSPRYVEGRRL